MNLKYKTLLSILLFFVFNNLLSQENPHERLINRLKDSGLTQKEIQEEINKMEIFYGKYIEEEFQKNQEKYNKKIERKESSKVECTDIPASEKAVLQAIYSNLNGSAWATNWDFNTPVTSWNAANGTGWFGIVVNDCHVEQFTVNNINVQGVFPNITELTHLKNLYIGHGMYGHSLPYYITGDFSSIGNLPLLNSLTLHNSDFQGEIPSTFNNLDLNFWGLTLAHCNLSNNSQLCSIISNFSNLNHLNLSSNYFSGVLPNCLSGDNFTQLKQIFMQSNNITDISIIETHSNLEALWFGSNLIHGNFPDLSNNINLSNTILELNEIQGQIPSNFPGKLYVLRLSYNKLEGDIPLINNYVGINYHSFDVRKNKFNFKDFENSFNYYQNNFTDFFYSNQAKIDTVINETVNVGSSYTMTMHTNGNFSSVEEYQWYKGVYPGGTPISGATQRQFTINNIESSNSGVYYCISKHPTITIPSDSNKNLVLVREPINLTVVNCQPLTGEIQPRENYDCGPSYTTAYSFSNYNPNNQYFWTFLDPNGNVITSSTLSGTNPVTFNQTGVNNINLVITSSDGCIHNFSYQVEIVECEPEPICETHLSFNFATPNTLLYNIIRLEIGTGIVNFINQNTENQLYITTIDDDKDIVRFSTVQQTFSVPWEQPYLNSSNEVIVDGKLLIQDSNYTNTIGKELNGIVNNTLIDKKINITFVLASQDNFSNISDVQLAYSNLINSNKTDKVFFVFFENGIFRDISTNTNLSPENYINAIIGSSAINFDSTGSVLDSNYKLFTVSEYTNVNFDLLIQQFIQDAYDDILDVTCNEPCSPIMGEIIPTIESAFCVGQKIDFNFSTTENIVSYSWSAVDNSTGNILNTYTFGNTFTTLFPTSGSYTINLEVVDNDGCSSLFTYNLNAINCIQNSCTENNPNSQVVKQYFINLINHLITLSSVPNGYTCPELTLLTPYVQPDDPVAIYNYFNDGAQIKFSFSDHGNSFDVWIVYSQSTVQDIDLSNYVSYDQVTSLDSKVITLNGITKGSVKHIEFCPDELHCKKHIAIVVDESGSIDESEARKIKSQLKSFIEQQTVDNETLGTNVHVSLIGLSDSDNPIRTDFDNLINNKLTNLNKSLYVDWINNYRSDRNGAIGVSPNSDYWNSGLIEAYSSGAELVILITDGCQTANANQLQQTVRNFNNNNGGTSINAPHLYVIGLDNGFYVDSDTPLSNRAASEDPNMNPLLERNSGVNSRVTSYLRTSLKYLMEYPANDFPVNDKYNFIYRPLDGSANPPLQMVDYFGIDDFNFFYDEPNYLYNGSVGAGTSCGDEIPLEKCNNCLNFKPIPGKEYVISAWVKEELKIQVKDYTSAELHVNFKNVNDGYIVGSEIICNTSGDIIDEWQRIFKKFSVPNDAVYIEIALVNNSGSVPVYFDDIRIHPVDGSMKSFVYDPETFRLMSELDENNFSTFYEYDNEGGLIRVKKETSRGVKTIQETRSGNVIKVE